MGQQGKPHYSIPGDKKNARFDLSKNQNRTTPSQGIKKTALLGPCWKNSALLGPCWKNPHYWVHVGKIPHYWVHVRKIPHYWVHVGKIPHYWVHVCTGSMLEKIHTTGSMLGKNHHILLMVDVGEIHTTGSILENFNTWYMLEQLPNTWPMVTCCPSLNNADIISQESAAKFDFCQALD